MITAFSLLNEHFALWAAPIFFESLLEIIVAGSFMKFKHALSAKLSSTKIAGKRLLKINHSFALLNWAKFKVGIRNCLLP